MSKKTATDPNNYSKLTTSTFFGGCLFVIGLIFAFANIFNWADYYAFQNGRIIEARVVMKSPLHSDYLLLAYRDYRGMDVEWATEEVSDELWEQLAVGDPVVGLVMEDSPSRVIIEEDLVLKRPLLFNGIIVTLIPLISGLLLLSWPILWEQKHRRDKWTAREKATAFKTNR